MDSYLKFICPLHTRDQEIEAFYRDPLAAFVNLTLAGQIRFLFGQAISLNYLEKAYHFDLPYFISLLKNRLIESFLPYTKQLITSEKLEPVSYCLYQKYFSIINLLLMCDTDEDRRCLIDCAPGISDIVYSFLKDTENSSVPVPCTSTFYESYLMFLNEEFCDISRIPRCDHFHISGVIALPQFTINNQLLIEHDITLGESYNYTYEDNQRFGEYPYSRGCFSIFSFWRGYNWRNLSYDTVVSILATYGALSPHCGESDSLKRAYYDVYQKLMNPMSTSAKLLPSISHNFILNFLVDIFTRFNTKSVDKEMMMSLFFNEGTEESKRLRSQLDQLFGQVAEANEALRSTLRNLGTGKMSSGSIPMFVESNATLVSSLLDAKTVKKEEDLSDDAEDPIQDNKKDSKKKNDPDYPEDDKDNRTSGKTSDDDQHPDDPTIEDDQKEEHSNKDEEPSLDQEDSESDKKDPASIEPKKNDSTDESDKSPETDIGDYTTTKNSLHTPLPKPRIPGMSIKSGIKLELAGDDETIDSFLYRKEVGSFIDDIVSNPNHIFSVQQIEALKIIKARLLWVLNVQSLYNLLKAISKA